MIQLPKVQKPEDDLPEIPTEILLVDKEKEEPKEGHKTPPPLPVKRPKSVAIRTSFSPFVSHTKPKEQEEKTAIPQSLFEKTDSPQTPTDSTTVILTKSPTPQDETTSAEKPATDTPKDSEGKFKRFVDTFIKYLIIVVDYLSSTLEKYTSLYYEEPDWDPKLFKSKWHFLQAKLTYLWKRMKLFYSSHTDKLCYCVFVICTVANTTVYHILFVFFAFTYAAIQYPYPSRVSGGKRSLIMKRCIGIFAFGQLKDLSYWNTSCSSHIHLYVFENFCVYSLTGVYYRSKCSTSLHSSGTFWMEIKTKSCRKYHQLSHHHLGGHSSSNSS